MNSFAAFWRINEELRKAIERKKQLLYDTLSVLGRILIVC